MNVELHSVYSRLVLCKRTTARTCVSGPSVAVEPGSEIRGRTNVDAPAVPDRLNAFFLFFFLSSSLLFLTNFLG